MGRALTDRPASREREHAVDALATDAVALAGRVDCPVYAVADAGITHEEAMERGLPVGDEPSEP